MTEASEHVSGDKNAPPEWEAAWRVLGPLADLITPMALRAAATLRLADLVTDGPVPVADLARRSQADPDALVRVLRHLVHHGVFEEPTPGTFGLNGTAALLRSDHPSAMQVWLDLDGFGGQMDVAFTGLMHTLRTGEPAWETVFGAPFWRHLEARPAMSASFDAAMASGPEYVADATLAYDWSTARRVVDVGGGSGALLAAVLEANAGLRATLVDLPDTVERGRRHLADLGLDGRCDFVAQSFFEPLPTGGDVYVLSSVIHDWPDREATAILARCADAAGQHGRVLLIEDTVGEDADSAMFTEMNLRMLVLCGGRERTVAEYTALAAAAGLDVTATRTTPLGQIGVECARSAPRMVEMSPNRPSR